MDGKETIQNNPYKERLDQLHKKQAGKIVKSGVLGRMARINPGIDSQLLNDGKPVVLSSIFGEVRIIFLAIQTLNTAGELRSSLHHVGQQVEGQDLTANTNLGVLESDLVLFDSILNELQTFKHEFAPNYNIEYGILQ